uniref:Ribosomal RNA-processing protein 7 C-terminal domain-containing protein n=1 Tax=Kalanchoe fedtschenkoi TaxID=63787 RepID=A0A7N0TAI2_KALFE
MAKEGVMKIAKGEKKQRRREKVKNVAEVVRAVDCSTIVENDGKKKRKKRQVVNESIANSGEADDGSAGKDKRRNKDEKTSRKKRKKDKDVVEALVSSRHGQSSTAEKIEVPADQIEDASKSSRRSKKKKKDRIHTSSNDSQQLKQEGGEAVEDDVLYMSSGDEDCSTGMKKWLTEYRDKRPGFEILQQRIDDFIIAHEEKLEQERKEREARIAEDGWTVVEHHKGRKKTTDAESGTAVGSVTQAAAHDQLAKKKQKGVGPDFYRFQKREAQRNAVMMLQSKFEEDKKRIQQLRAARKFRPY